MNRLEQYRKDQNSAVELLNQRIRQQSNDGNPVKFIFERKPDFYIDHRNEEVRYKLFSRRAPKFVGPIVVANVTSLYLPHSHSDYIDYKVTVLDDGVRYGYGLNNRSTRDLSTLNGIAEVVELSDDLFKPYGEY